MIRPIKVEGKRIPIVEAVEQHTEQLVVIVDELRTTQKELVELQAFVNKLKSHPEFLEWLNKTE